MFTITPLQRDLSIRFAGTRTFGDVKGDICGFASFLTGVEDLIGALPDDLQSVIQKAAGPILPVVGMVSNALNVICGGAIDVEVVDPGGKLKSTLTDSKFFGAWSYSQVSGRYISGLSHIIGPLADAVGAIGVVLNIDNYRKVWCSTNAVSCNSIDRMLRRPPSGSSSTPPVHHDSPAAPDGRPQQIAVWNATDSAFDLYHTTYTYSAQGHSASYIPPPKLSGAFGSSSTPPPPGYTDYLWVAQSPLQDPSNPIVPDGYTLVASGAATASLVTPPYPAGAIAIKDPTSTLFNIFVPVAKGMSGLSGKLVCGPGSDVVSGPGWQMCVNRYRPHGTLVAHPTVPLKGVRRMNDGLVLSGYLGALGDSTSSAPTAPAGYTYYGAAASADGAKLMTQSADGSTSSAGLPTWAWIAIGVSAAAAVGGVGYVVLRKKKR